MAKDDAADRGTPRTSAEKRIIEMLGVALISVGSILIFWNLYRGGIGFWLAFPGAVAMALFMQAIGFGVRK